MSESTDNFFEGKRPWSVIKDKVLQDYISPYLAKVSRLDRPILLIDGYAGPGVFKDGSPGSPVIMCRAAEKYAKGKYRAIFINKDEEYHKTLESVLRQANWSSARAVLGDSTVLLQTLPAAFQDQTVFLYLDPFGLKGCEFSLLLPFLNRKPQFSTEILLNMSMPVVHRLAARHAVKEGKQDEQIITYHQILTKVFGGEYWKEIMWQENTSSEKKEFQLIQAYQEKLARYLRFVGSCPVRERTDRRIKYFIVFASRHSDTVLLLNDIMANAYFAKMHEASYIGTLFEDIDWREMRSLANFDKVILDTVKNHSGETREAIWLRIVQEHFMRYLESEYKEAVQKLIDERRLVSPTPRKTRRLNDKCILKLP